MVELERQSNRGDFFKIFNINLIISHSIIQIYGALLRDNFYKAPKAFLRIRVSYFSVLINNYYFYLL